MSGLDGVVIDALVAVAPFELDPATVSTSMWLGDAVDTTRPGLGLDSLTLLEAIAWLDEELGVELLAEYEPVLLTVADVARAYERCLAPRRGVDVDPEEGPAHGR